jgi:hypothetical protein
MTMQLIAHIGKEIGIRNKDLGDSRGTKDEELYLSSKKNVSCIMQKTPVVINNKPNNPMV